MCNNNNNNNKPLNVMTVHRTSSKIHGRCSKRLDDAIKKMLINVEKLTKVEGRECGRTADSRTYKPVMKAVKSGEVDLIVMEDLTPLTYDTARAWDFVQSCVDEGVRVVVPRHAVDTAAPNWGDQFLLATSGMAHLGGRRRRRRNQGIAPGHAESRCRACG